MTECGMGHPMHPEGGPLSGHVSDEDVLEHRTQPVTPGRGGPLTAAEWRQRRASMPEAERQMSLRLALAVRRTVKEGRDARMNDALLSQAIIELPEWQQMSELAAMGVAEEIEKDLPAIAARYFTERATEIAHAVAAEWLKQVEALGMDPVPMADLRRLLTEAAE